MKEKDQQRRNKIIQYAMTAVLLALAFLLPVCAVKKQAERQNSTAETARESASGQTESAVLTENQNGSGSGEENPDQSGAAGSRQTIVIDPGHGGDDPGMIGESGISEKVLNLIYAQKLKALLEAEGFHIVLTRSTEDGLYDDGVSNKKAQDMQRRCAVIEEEQPVLTVSIHQNSYAEDTSVRGPQVFYYEQSAEGEKLAAAIQDSLNTALSVERPRQQKGNASYYILKRSKSVTVIVECGFLTNPEEEALLQEESYQDQVAQAICEGVLNYLQNAA